MLPACSRSSLSLPALNGSAFAQSRDIGSSPGGLPNTSAILSAATAQPTGAAMEGFTMINGRAHLSRGGQLLPIDREITMRLSPTGAVTLFDGRQFAIPAGHPLALDGRIVALNQGGGCE